MPQKRRKKLPFFSWLEVFIKDNFLTNADQKAEVLPTVPNEKISRSYSLIEAMNPPFRLITEKKFNENYGTLNLGNIFTWFLVVLFNKKEILGVH